MLEIINNTFSITYAYIQMNGVDQTQNFLRCSSLNVLLDDKIISFNSTPANNAAGIKFSTVIKCNACSYILVFSLKMR